MSSAVRWPHEAREQDAVGLAQLREVSAPCAAGVSGNRGLTPLSHCEAPSLGLSTMDELLIEERAVRRLQEGFGSGQPVTSVCWGLQCHAD